MSLKYGTFCEVVVLKLRSVPQYHGFVVKRTFSMGLMAAPGTDTILGRLGGDGADQVRAGP